MATIRGKHEGSISQDRSGKYRAMVSLDGKRLSKSFKTKQECKAWIR